MEAIQDSIDWLHAPRTGRTSDFLSWWSRGPCRAELRGLGVVGRTEDAFEWLHAIAEAAP